MEWAETMAMQSEDTSSGEAYASALAIAVAARRAVLARPEEDQVKSRLRDRLAEAEERLHHSRRKLIHRIALGRVAREMLLAFVPKIVIRVEKPKTTKRRRNERSW
jgi:hypothetical protein